jgi:hypothetical protein
MRVLNRRVVGIPQGAVYVGRPTKWGNPFVVGRHGVQGECVRLYAEWIKTQPTLLAAAQAELGGRDLVCWCAPKACHADVLMAIANGWTEVSKGVWVSPEVI